MLRMDVSCCISRFFVLTILTGIPSIRGLKFFYPPKTANQILGAPTQLSKSFGIIMCNTANQIFNILLPVVRGNGKTDTCTLIGDCREYSGIDITAIIMQITYHLYTGIDQANANVKNRG